MGRRKQPMLDLLEGRDLMSITPIVGLLNPPMVTTSSLANVAVPPVTSFSGGSGVTTDPAAPLPNETVRRVFKASFTGRVVELPPRLVDQSRQFYILAPGGTNQFLHGTIQMRYYTPSPAAVAPFNQLTGTYSISDRSTASGGVILADLTGDPSKVDGRGRPTQLNFVVNGGGGSGGIYASSVGNGVVNIKYQGNRASVTVVGSIFTLGIANNLDVFQSNSHR